MISQISPQRQAFPMARSAPPNFQATPTGAPLDRFEPSPEPAPAKSTSHLGGLARLGLGTVAALAGGALLGPATPAVASVTASRHFVPRSLPLRGDDYSIAVNRGNPLQDVTVQKRGGTIQVTHRSNPAENATIHVGTGSVAIQRPNAPSTLLRQSGNQIAITRPNGGGPNVTITHQGNRIVIDRSNNAGDVAFVRIGNQFTIDRYGAQNDVSITTSPNRTVIDRYQAHEDTVITTAPGMELDPVTWQNELTLDPQAWDLLNKWFEDGQLSLDDLVAVTESGQVLEWDGLLR